MDLDIPACAMFRSVGTVIVRLRQDEGRCRVVRPASGMRALSACERCNRTILISKHNSDCDSDVEKSRPYSSSTARSRYVNVCAAVCLLLLVGGLSPQSSAAPHRRRTMDRQRRAVDGKTKDLWENPCDYTSNSGASSLNTKELAHNLAIDAKNALKKAAEYKDQFAKKLHSYTHFEDLARMHDTYDWMRALPFYVDDVLPREKVLNTPLPDQHMNELMGRMDDVMPAMYKSLKTVVAGLYAFSTEGLNVNIISDETLKDNITNTMHDVRAVLCFFSDIMKARNHPIEPLMDEEIPDFTKQDIGILLYRDTLTYLDYLSQVFQKYSETVPA